MFFVALNLLEMFLLKTQDEDIIVLKNKVNSQKFRLLFLEQDKNINRPLEYFKRIEQPRITPNEFYLLVKPLQIQQTHISLGQIIKQEGRIKNSINTQLSGSLMSLYLLNSETQQLNEFIFEASSQMELLSNKIKKLLQILTDPKNLNMYFSKNMPDRSHTILTKIQYTKLQQLISYIEKLKWLVLKSKAYFLEQKSYLRILKSKNISLRQLILYFITFSIPNRQISQQLELFYIDNLSNNFMENKRLMIYSSDNKRKKTADLSPTNIMEIKFQSEEIMKARANSLQPIERSKNIHKNHIQKNTTTCIFPTSTPVQKSRLVQLIDDEMNILEPQNKKMFTKFQKTQYIKSSYPLRQEFHSVRQKISQLQQLKRMTLVKEKKKNKLQMQINGMKAPEFQTIVWGKKQLKV